MAKDGDGLIIYGEEVDELRPVNTPKEKKAWEERMRKRLGDSGFNVPDSARVFDTCCGGSFDDCGVV